MLNLPLHRVITDFERTERGKSLWAFLLLVTTHIDLPDQLVSCPAVSCPQNSSFLDFVQFSSLAEVLDFTVLRSLCPYESVSNKDNINVAVFGDMWPCVVTDGQPRHSLY